MPYTNRASQIRMLTCAIVFLCAGLFQWLAPIDSFVNGIISTFCYLGLIIFWQRSLRRRLLDDDTNRLMLGITIGLVAWMVIRIVKYDMLGESYILNKYLWYSYYIPQIICVTLAVITVSRIGIDPGIRRNMLNWLWVPSVALIALVMSNDLHQYVFIFDINEPKPDLHHRFGIGYVLITAYLTLMLIGVIVIAAIKCKDSASRKHLYIPSIAFGLGFLLCLSVGHQQMYNMPEAFSFAFVITLESCIQVGLIPANINYEHFFYLTRTPSIITNNEGQIVYRTESSIGYDFDFPAPHYEVTSSIINGGSAIWVNDYTELDIVKDELSEIRESLAEDYSLLQAQSTLLKRRSRIEAETNTYERLSKFIQPSIAKIKKEIDLASGTESRMPLAKACVYTSYVKRRSNLMLISDTDGLINAAELTNCITESSSALNLTSISSSVFGRLDGMVRREDILDAYDTFERIIEKYLNQIDYLMVSMKSDNGLHTITMMINGSNIPLDDTFPGATQFHEDDTDYFTISFGKEVE